MGSKVPGMLASGRLRRTPEFIGSKSSLSPVSFVLPHPHTNTLLVCIRPGLSVSRIVRSISLFVHSCSSSCAYILCQVLVKELGDKALSLPVRKAGVTQ